MSDRVDWYYRQLVSEADLDDAFSDLENADRAIMADMGVIGILSGLSVTEHAGTPNLTVDASGPGIAYDVDGQRIRVSALQNVDVSEDSSSVSTSVVGVGNERWVSVFVKFKRVLSDPQIDGNSDTVYFDRAESFEIVVNQGSETTIGIATRPALLADGLLLVDINRTQGQTQILNADLSVTRRQDAIVSTSSPRSLRHGQVEAALAALLGFYNNHVNGAADPHGAGALNYLGGAAWADGTTNPAATVEAQLDKIVTDLNPTAGGASGAHRVGVAALNGASGNIVAGTLFAALTALKLAANHEWTSGGATWADGAPHVDTSVLLEVRKIINDLGSQVTANDGGLKVGVGVRTAWLGGRTNPATTVYQALDKIVTDLAATTSNDDGAERIGAQAATGYSAGSVRSQLAEVLAGTQTFTGAKTFDNITASAGNKYKVSSRTVTRILDAVGHIEDGFPTPGAGWVAGNAMQHWAQTSVVTFAPMTFVLLDLPHNAVLTQLRVNINGGGSSLPANMPTIKLYGMDIDANNQAQIGATTTDTSPSGAAYGATHWITLSGLSETIDRATKRYSCQVNGEAGVGSTVGLTIWGIEATFTVTEIAEA